MTYRFFGTLSAESFPSETKLVAAPLPTAKTVAVVPTKAMLAPAQVDYFTPKDPVVAPTKLDVYVEKDPVLYAPASPKVDYYTEPEPLPSLPAPVKVDLAPEPEPLPSLPAPTKVDLYVPPAAKEPEPVQEQPLITLYEPVVTYETKKAEMSPPLYQTIQTPVVEVVQSKEVPMNVDPKAPYMVAVEDENAKAEAALNTLPVRDAGAKIVYSEPEPKTFYPDQNTADEAIHTLDTRDAEPKRFDPRDFDPRDFGSKDAEDVVQDDSGGGAQDDSGDGYKREVSGFVGRVVDQGGFPIAGAVVEVGRPNAAGSMFTAVVSDTVTGEDGRFVVEVPVSEWILRIRARGYVTAEGAESLITPVESLSAEVPVFDLLDLTFYPAAQTSEDQGTSSKSWWWKLAAGAGVLGAGAGLWFLLGKKRKNGKRR